METAQPTIAGLDGLIDKWAALEDEIDELKKNMLKPLVEKLEKLEAHIMAQFTAADITSFRAKNFLVSRVVRYTVTTPKSREQKAAYFEWLKAMSEDLYWSHMSVNSQTLNSFYKEQMEQAKEDGDMEFKIPGLGEPEAKPYLQKRKR